MFIKKCDYNNVDFIYINKKLKQRNLENLFFVVISIKIKNLLYLTK